MTCQPDARAQRRVRTLLGLAIGPVLLAGPLARAQDRSTSEAGSEVEISVRDVATEGQLIRVPVNKSVLVDFSVPVREVRLAKSEFAEVTAISPQQILVTGKSFGTTQMIIWIDGNDQRVFDVAVDLELDRLLTSIRS
ncbi:unnamed protein product, partial [marine sediment metagenome]